MRKKVLIVEDEKVLLKNLASCLRNSAIEPICAASVDEARQRLDSHAISMVCVDIQLGDGNGIELLAEVRADDPAIPLVVMTGQDCVSNRMRAEEVEVSAFLAKPFALARFRELVRTLLMDGTGAPVPARGPSVLMYSHDTIGLGHMRRNSNIASRLVGMMPEASVLMMVGSPAGAVFDLPPGVDFIKLPSLAKVSRGVWRPSSLRISTDATREIRAGLIQRTVETFCPDVVLIDHEPAGVAEELLPSLEALRAHPSRPRIVLGLRDILDDPVRTSADWARRGVDRLIRKYYDDVLVYGDSSIFPTHQAYGLDALVGDRLHYCGYVTNAQKDRLVPPACDDAPPQIVAAGGGGRDACPILDAVVDGLGQMSETVRNAAVVIAGPLMDPELRAGLEAKADAAQIGFLTSTPDLPGFLSTADLFVTMGGYNALTEAIAVGCPTLVIPRVGPSAEQRLRANRFAERRLVETLSLEDATPERLAQRFTWVRAGARRREPALPLDGAASAARHLAAMLAERHPAADFQEPRRMAHG